MLQNVTKLFYFDSFFHTYCYPANFKINRYDFQQQKNNVNEVFF